jgi:cell shape-determining protein MreD
VGLIFDLYHTRFYYVHSLMLIFPFWYKASIIKIIIYNRYISSSLIAPSTELAI